MCVKSFTQKLIYAYVCVCTRWIRLFKIVVDSWKFTMLLLYIFLVWLTNFYNFRFKWTATAGIGRHTTKAWLSKLVNFQKGIWTWGRMICNKILFQTWKNATETSGMLQNIFGTLYMNRASIFEWHKRFKESRESVRDDEGCVRNKEVNRPDLIGQRFRVRVTTLRF